MASQDAFGRSRVSEPFTTFNYYPSALSNNTGLDEDMWVTSGNGETPTYNADNYIAMTTTTAASSYVLRQTINPSVYLPGKSRLLYFTGVMMAGGETGTITSSVGIFSTDSPPVITQGTAFQAITTAGAGLLYWTNKQQGIIAAEQVLQTSWNIDTFDGTGPSGKTITFADMDKTILLIIDQERLGVGRIRCGFIIDGITYYAHQFTNTGISVQYTSTPRLPLSYMINDTSSINSMRQMCSTAISEGGYFTTGRLGSWGNGNNLIDLNTTQKIVLLAFRIGSGYPTATMVTNKISSFFTGSGSNYGYYEVQLFTPTNGATTSSPLPAYTAIPNSPLEYVNGNGTIYVNNDGYIINSEYVEGRASERTLTSDYELLLTRNTLSINCTLVLCAISSTTNTSMGISINYIIDV